MAPEACPNPHDTDAQDVALAKASGDSFSLEPLGLLVFEELQPDPAAGHQRRRLAEQRARGLEDRYRRGAGIAADKLAVQRPAGLETLISFSP